MKDFARQIEARFLGKFEQVWQEALGFYQKYDKGILLSQSYFYETVYKPNRDKFAHRWTALAEGKEEETS